MSTTNLNSRTLGISAMKSAILSTLALSAAGMNYTPDAEADRVVNLPGLSEEPAFSMFSGCGFFVNAFFLGTRGESCD
jgi:hypothetical protein